MELASSLFATISLLMPPGFQTLLVPHGQDGDAVKNIQGLTNLENMIPEEAKERAMMNARAEALPSKGILDGTPQSSISK
jgi:hypothetical protein